MIMGFIGRVSVILDRVSANYSLPWKCEMNEKTGAKSSLVFEGLYLRA